MPQDPWQDAAKNFKAQPGGSPASTAAAAPDEDWKLWQGGGAGGEEQPTGVLGKINANWESNTAPQDTGHAFTDFVHNAGGRAAKSFVQPFLHPIDTLTGAARQVFDPLYGAEQGAEDAKDKHPIANLTGDLAAGALQGGLLGGAGEGLTKIIPSKARAGTVFQSIAKDVGDRPVQLTRSMEPLERAQQLSARGHGTVGAIDNLYNRINQVNPMDYNEARDRASALSTLTSEDKLRATKSLTRQAKLLGHAFNEDIGDTAESAGRGEDFRNAMKEYHRASQLEDAGQFALKRLLPAVGVGAAGKAAYDLFNRK